MRAAPTRPGTPVASSLVAEPVADVTPATTYTVKAGDNLSTIAKKNHTTVAQLTAANSLANNALLRPGQKLIIPGKPASAPAAATAVGAAGTPKGSTKVETVTRSTESMKHTVRPGETLGSIARHYQVRTGEIAVANNITDPSKINAGMELVIPGWTPAGKTAKNGKNGKAAPTNNTAPASAAASSATTPPASLSGNTPETITPPPAAEPAPSGPPVPVIRLDDPVAPAPRL
jgi:LysM repeat protein